MQEDKVKSGATKILASLSDSSSTSAATSTEENSKKHGLLHRLFSRKPSTPAPLDPMIEIRAILAKLAKDGVAGIGVAEYCKLNDYANVNDKISSFLVEYADDFRPFQRQALDNILS